MKKLFGLLLFLSLAVAGIAQDGPVMSFESMEVDYGKIEQNADGNRKFVFTNTGTEPLVIKNARGSCGCTVPTWPKEPIMPGEKASIDVKYDTNRVGPFTKTITLTTNEAIGTKMLTIKGEVLKKEADQAVPASKPTILHNH
ncbi:MAG: DUF1573 domain-containing protein [Saprospiraceae bacterium]|nr:DUF1573 domain-containing protein [Saprospiraceae bacterium]